MVDMDSPKRWTIYGQMMDTKGGPFMEKVVYVIRAISGAKGLSFAIGIYIAH
jgi:hypothetical protein